MVDLNLASTPFGWFIIGYLMLSGVACGASISAVVLMRSTDEASRHIVQAALWIAIAAMSLGGFFLVADLESPGRFLLNFLEFNASSVIAWGTRIITIYLALCIFTLLILTRSSTSNTPSLLMRGLLFVFSLLVGTYPAFVLGQGFARPLWDALWLGPLFLVVGVHSGLALLYLLTREKWSESRQHSMSRLDIPFIVLQAILFAGLIAVTSVSASGIERVFYGELAIWFWLGVVAIGWVIPFLVGIKRSVSRQYIVLSQLCFLAGALALRVVVVFGGQGAESFLGV